MFHAHAAKKTVHTAVNVIQILNLIVVISAS